MLPGGQNLTLQVSDSNPVQDVQRALCTFAEANGVLLLNWLAYQMHVYRSDVILDDPLQEIGEVPYVSQCRQMATVPKLVLVQQQHDPYTATEKENALEVSGLVGKVISGDDREMQNFREVMARVRYLERKRRKEHRGQVKSEEGLQVYLADDSIPFRLPSKGRLIITATLPLKGCKKTMVVQGKAR